MKQTEKLYFADCTLRQFTASVLSCEAAGEGYLVVLDRTAFFPEGGGQPSDLGTLGGAQVTQVRERGEHVVHTVDSPLAVGSTVFGEIDWDRRFTFMQQHSGEHILSGIVHRKFGLDNVGFHLGRDAVTVDFNGPLSGDQLEQIERETNDAIYANLPVCISFPSSEALRSLDYRSKKELSGQVRIVSIDGCDCCACCGTHVSGTGEIGIVKILSAQNYKGGTRLSIVCGRRALEDYVDKNRAAYDISALLSVRPDETVQGVERVLREAASLRQKAAALQTALFGEKASAFPRDAQAVCAIEEDLSPAEVRQFCQLLSKRFPQAVVLSYKEQAGCQFALGSESADVRPLGKELVEATGGRGGGSRELVQGVLNATAQDIGALLAARGFCIRP